MKKLLSLSLITVCLALVASCSSTRFNQNQQALTSEPRVFKVAIDRISGDPQGELTAVIIQALSRESMLWQYEPIAALADYVLHLSVLSREESPLGFRYDLESFNNIRVDRLVQDEARKSLMLEGRLCKLPSGKQVAKTFRVEGSCDYDYINSHALFDAAFVNNEGDLESVLEFSLGQLDALEGAQSASKQALYTDVANNFVEGFDYLYHTLDK